MPLASQPGATALGRKSKIECGWAPGFTAGMLCARLNAALSRDTWGRAAYWDRTAYGIVRWYDPDLAAKVR